MAISAYVRPYRLLEQLGGSTDVPVTIVKPDCSEELMIRSNSPHRYAMFINKVVAQKPSGMTLAVYPCDDDRSDLSAAAVSDKKTNTSCPGW